VERSVVRGDLYRPFQRANRLLLLAELQVELRLGSADRRKVRETPLHAAIVFEGFDQLALIYEHNAQPKPERTLSRGIGNGTAIARLCGRELS
jgi:hypothetical protein